MNDKNTACICKCQNICECSPDESGACEEELKLLETRRVSISVDVTSIENQSRKNDTQETQYETPSTNRESNPCIPQEAEAMETGSNVKRPCNSPNPTKGCMEIQKNIVEKELNKPSELKSPRASAIKLFSKKSSANSITTINSDYSKDEWDRFGLFIASECKAMSKENAKNFKIKCLELILEYQ